VAPHLGRGRKPRLGSNQGASFGYYQVDSVLVPNVPIKLVFRFREVSADLSLFTSS
jgi:hypothetical protein